VGWLLEVLGHRDAARACYELALAGAAPVDRSDALHRLAVLAHQSNELERAVQLYEVVATYPTPRAMTVSRELARIYERQIGDPERALVHARCALQLLALIRDFAAKRSLAPARWTVERLERKLGVFGTSVAVSPGGAGVSPARVASLGLEKARAGARAEARDPAVPHQG